MTSLGTTLTTGSTQYKIDLLHTRYFIRIHIRHELRKQISLIIDTPCVFA